jgi:hypothetical protein
MPRRAQERASVSAGKVERLAARQNDRSSRAQALAELATELHPIDPTEANRL